MAELATMRVVADGSVAATVATATVAMPPRPQQGSYRESSLSNHPAFQAAPNNRFTMQGTRAPSSWWDLGAGMDVALNEAFRVYLEGQNRIAPGSSQSLNYGGGFRWRF